MMLRRFLGLRYSFALCCRVLLFSLVAVPGILEAEPVPSDLGAFNAYVAVTESRLMQQHRASNGFLAPSALGPQNESKLRRGELVIERLTPSNLAFSGALLHHWRGTAFVAGAKARDFERLMRNFNAYPQTFAPQVLQARLLSQHGDHLQATMRVRQKHVITVVLDTAYDIDFAWLDAQHGYSISKSSAIAEIDSPGTPAEHALSAREEHGFLWRQNTYWSYEERDGGLYMQVESISLSRSVPLGLGWAVGPFIESVPRESLEFTLHSTCNALRR